MAVGVSAGRSGEGGRRLPPGKQWAMVLEWHKWHHHVINVKYVNMYCTIVYTCATLKLGLIYHNIINIILYVTLLLLL